MSMREISGRRRTRRGGETSLPEPRKVDYRNLRNPFPPMSVFTEDRIEAIHDAALTVLETLGIKVLLPQARAAFRAAGAIVDETSQMVAELCAQTPAEDADIAFDALSDVQPGGHFFGTPHTMDRYRSAFYEPLIGDLSNFGTWEEHGAQDASTRATGMWQRIVADAPGPGIDAGALARLQDYIRVKSDAGGAPPES